MGGMADAYERCIGWLRAANRTVNTLEAWLYYSVRRAARLPVACHTFPFVLVRKDSAQPTAATMCGVTYPGANGTYPNGSVGETPERRACFRGAYPDEAWRWPEP